MAWRLISQFSIGRFHNNCHKCIARKNTTLRKCFSDHENFATGWGKKTPFGTRYVVEGIMEVPDGRTPSIRSVWFVAEGEEIPRFATAYPAGGGR